MTDSTLQDGLTTLARAAAQERVDLLEQLIWEAVHGNVFPIDVELNTILGGTVKYTVTQETANYIRRLEAEEHF